jgi:hypothetical protein
VEYRCAHSRRLIRGGFAAIAAIGAGLRQSRRCLGEGVPLVNAIADLRFQAFGKPERKPPDEIRVMKDDPVAVEASAEEINACTVVFRRVSGFNQHLINQKGLEHARSHA